MLARGDASEVRATSDGSEGTAGGASTRMRNSRFGAHGLCRWGSGWVDSNHPSDHRSGTVLRASSSQAGSAPGAKRAVKARAIKRRQGTGAESVACEEQEPRSADTPIEDLPLPRESELDLVEDRYRRIRHVQRENQLVAPCFLTTAAAWYLTSPTTLRSWVFCPRDAPLRTRVWRSLRRLATGLSTTQPQPMQCQSDSRPSCQAKDEPNKERVRLRKACPVQQDR